MFFDTILTVIIKDAHADSDTKTKYVKLSSRYVNYGLHAKCDNVNKTQKMKMVKITLIPKRRINA